MYYYCRQPHQQSLYALCSAIICMMDTNNCEGLRAAIIMIIYVFCFNSLTIVNMCKNCLTHVHIAIIIYYNGVNKIIIMI